LISLSIQSGNFWIHPRICTSWVTVKRGTAHSLNGTESPTQVSTYTNRYEREETVDTRLRQRLKTRTWLSYL